MPALQRSIVAYVISAVEAFADPMALARYAQLTGPSMKHFGGHFVVSNSAPVVVEGSTTSAHVSMVEFPSMESAKAWYDSPQNSEARDLAAKAFTGRVLMFVEGVPVNPA